MAIVKYQNSIADSATGRPIANVSVQVFEYPSGDAATVYDSASVVSTAAIVTDKDGAYSFYAEDGHYNIVYYHGGITKTLVDVLVGGIQGDPGPASSGYTLLSSYSSLAAMVAAAGTGKQTVGIAADTTITANITIPANIEILPLNGAVIGHGAYTISYAGATARWPLSQVFNGTGAVTGLKESRPEWFGTNGLGKAIDSLSSGGVLRFAGGTYALTAGVSKTLTSAQKWIADAQTTIQYTGAEISWMVLLELAGNAFSIQGPITFDANQDARFALRVNNSSATMATATYITFDGVKGINAYSTDTVGHVGSGGIMVHGGYNKVTLKNCGAINISRAAGVGTPGTTSSTGIAVTNGGINAYAREVVIEDPYIDTVTSEEVDGDANNTDADGIIALAPSTDLFAGLRPDTVLKVRGGKFINCRGRSIKTQMDQNLIDGPTFIRTADADKSIAIGHEVDFQYGSGTLKNFRCNYSELTGGITPFGVSFSLVAATVRNLTTEAAIAYGEGSIVIDTGEIINHVPAATGKIPYFLALTSTVGSSVNAKFSNVSVQNISFLGIGQLFHFVYGDLGYVRQMNTSNNFISNISGYLAYTTATAATCMWTAQNNTLPSSSSALLWYASSGAPPTLIAPMNNPNFNGASVRDKGESVTLADDATYTFANHGASGWGIYTIKNNYNQTSQAMFTLTSTIVDFANAASTAVVFGAGTNPDTDAKLNIWVDANGRVNIKNRLGSSRIFTLNSL